MLWIAFFVLCLLAALQFKKQIANKKLLCALTHTHAEMCTSSSSTSLSASKEDIRKCRMNKRKRKEKEEEPNIDVMKGGLDGIQEGTVIHISDSFGFPFYHACTHSFPVVAYFSGSWIGPAKELNDLVIELSDHYVNLTFLKIDLPHENNHRELFEFLEELNIKVLPAFLFYHEGKQVFKLVGAFPDELIHLAHALYVRHVLRQVKRLKKEVTKASKDGAPELYGLEHDLSMMKEHVGVALEMYEPSGLLE